MRNFNRAKVAMALISLLYAASSLACSCASTSISERFDQFEYVFSAEILAAELLVKPDATIRSTADEIRIKTGIRNDFKGNSSDLEYLYTNAGGSSCGIQVTVGSTHTFLVNESGMVFLCGGTVKSEEGATFYQLLKDRNLLEDRNNQ